MSADNKAIERLIQSEHPSIRKQLAFVIRLSIPAMLAQLTSIIMQYIDAAMVGQLGKTDAAAIGLVSTSTWLFGGLVSAVSAGFVVQVTQHIGAGKKEEARNIMKQGLIAGVIISVILTLIAVLISGELPVWLGGEKGIQKKASAYFLIYMLMLPALQMNNLATGLLQGSGNMKVPSVLNIMTCVLDVLFNWILIFPAKSFQIVGVHVTIPGFHLGIKGAALGTMLAETVVACIMMTYLLFFSDTLRLRRHEKVSFAIKTMKRALKIAIPVAAEQVFMCGAMVATTVMIAPLGAVSIAANSFAITAESLCYMPAYGIASASAALIGQSFGAKKERLVRSMSFVSVGFGMLLAVAVGGLMYLFAPFMMGILSSDAQICALGAKILRVEAFAEPLYAASIVATGAFRGVGNTLIPTGISFVSMWLVRIPLAYVLIGFMGLTGAWVAMCTELCVRGLIFIIYLFRKI